MDDLQGRMHTWQSSSGFEVLPIVQVDGCFNEFCRGDTLEIGENLKYLVNVEPGVWYLRTADVRVFGFFVAQDHFVAVLAEEKWRLNRYGYRPYADEVHRCVAKIGAESLIITSGDPRAVVSNFN